MAAMQDPKDNRIKILKALAHPVRLGLIETLSCRRLRAGELAELFPADRTTISKHIAILREAGAGNSKGRAGDILQAADALP